MHTKLLISYKPLYMSDLKFACYCSNKQTLNQTCTVVVTSKL